MSVKRQIKKKHSIAGHLADAAKPRTNNELIDPAHLNINTRDDERKLNGI